MNVDEAGHEDFQYATGYNQSRVGYQGGASDAIKADIDGLLCKDPGLVPTPPTGNGYVKAAGFNCYGARGDEPAHGASDKEDPPSSSCGDMTVEECQQQCDGTTGCTGITVGRGQNGKYPCYRKSDITLDRCDHGTSFDTYVKADWYPARGFNCYGSRDGGSSHGALDLEDPAWASCGTMSLDECKSKCAELDGCDSITVRGSGDSVECFRKGNTALSSCDSGTDFDTYLFAGKASVQEFL